MNEQQRVYYRIHTTTEVSDVLSDFNEDDLVHAVTDLAVDPLDTGDDYYEEYAARATDAEHAAWTQAYDTFSGAVRRAGDDLAAARAAWEAAQGRHTAALLDAWNDYAPTDTAICQRSDEVVLWRERARKEELAAAARAAQEAQDKEDAELGARTWVLFTPNSRDVKAAPDMMVPVIHVAGCPVTQGHENLPYARTHKYARRAEVEQVLLEGAFRYSRGRRTEDKLPTKLCGRCKPGETLRAALGTVYEDWLERVESIQEPMPTHKGMAAALGLKDEWRGYRTPGYTTVSSRYYRDEKLIEPHEELIGWYSPESELVTVNPEALARLEEVLPGRGFAVRRINEPAAFHVGDRPCATAVAVRRMTRAERRRHKEGTPPVHTVDLEDAGG